MFEKHKYLAFQSWMDWARIPEAANAISVIACLQGVDPYCQKKPFENVLLNNFPEKFPEIHRKTPTI